MSANGIERFSHCADNYAKYRPSYPDGAIDSVAAYAGLDKDAVIADVGSGTGKLTELLLRRCWRVFAVEPNANMRAAAEQTLSSDPNFHSVAAGAEETTLPDGSVDLITVAQAFHWFDPDACRTEFRRILKSGGAVALVWNRRDDDASAFMRDYEQTVHQWCAEPPNVTYDQIDDEVYRKFFTGPFEIHRFSWRQTFDFGGLWGRALSSSYAPTEGHPNREPLREALRVLFDKYQEEGRVRFDYRTETVLGRL